MIDFGDCLYLLASRNEFYHLLQCPSPMLIKCNLHHLWRSVVDQDGSLFIVGELEQFLTQIIAKRVYNV